MASAVSRFIAGLRISLFIESLIEQRFDATESRAQLVVVLAQGIDLCSLFGGTAHECLDAEQAHAIGIDRGDGSGGVAQAECSVEILCGGTDVTYRRGFSVVA